MYKKMLKSIWQDPVGFSQSDKPFDLIDLYCRHPERLKDLKEMLSSDNEDVIRAAVFVASELGVRCEPVFDECIELIEGDWPDDIVVDAYNCIAACLDVKGLQPIKYILSGFNRDRIRSECIVFVASWSVGFIIKVASYIEDNDLGVEHVIGFLAVQRAESEGYLEVMIELAESRSFILSCYALAIAYRYSEIRLSIDVEFKSESGLELLSCLARIVEFDNLIEDTNTCIESYRVFLNSQS